ncbi:YceI family protein [Vulgatibacter incomptus]|nr:YceI family protein [Vulgatibacter incomptus]
MSTAASYQIDPTHSTAQFKVRHMMVSHVRGEFTALSGTIQFDKNAPEKIAIDATVDATTINTRDAKRDGHLKSADFFDVEKFPSLTFKSKSAKAAGPNKLEVLGDLTMHGVTKTVTLVVEGLENEVKDPWGGVRMGATGTTKVNRKDFGLNWNAALEAGGVMVGDDVTITIDVELVKQAESSAAK